MYKKLLRTLALIVSIFIFNSFINYNVFATVVNIKNNDEIRLQDNFYKAINKNYIQSSKLKENEEMRSTFTETKDKVNYESEEIMKDLLLNGNKYSDNTTERKIFNLYNNYINLDERNRQGIKPIKKYIDKVKNSKNLDEITNLLGDPNINIFTNLINFSVGIEDNKNILYVSSTALVLGDSGKYKGNENIKDKDSMKKYLVNILKLSGYSQDESMKKVKNFFCFENKLASSIISASEFTEYYNNKDNNNNNYSISDINKLSNNLDLAKIISNLKYENIDKVVVFEPKWLEKLNELYKEENLDIIKNYIEMVMLSSASKYLSEDFRNEYLNLQKLLYNVKNISIEEESKEFINKNFDSELNKLYVDKVFNDDIKNNVKEFIEEIITVYKTRINNLDWMSNSTKENAIKKLSNIQVSIGYSTKWTNYSDLDIKSYKDGGSLLENIISLEMLSYKKPINNKTSFSLISPKDVNAYYDSKANEIIIPAAILQKPFYDINQSKEKNLGGLGIIIGHEITHAFDNKGAKYDEDGNMKDWWTDTDYKKYEERMKKIKEFYSNIEVLPGIKVNGEATLGENIADIGSMTCMLDILKSIPNVNYDEFFKNFATVWRDITTDEYKTILLKTDTHSPSDIRVNSVLKQFEKFYEVYDINENDGMYLNAKDRLKIW